MSSFTNFDKYTKEELCDMVNIKCTPSITKQAVVAKLTKLEKDTGIPLHVHNKYSNIAGDIMVIGNQLRDEEIVKLFNTANALFNTGYEVRYIQAIYNIINEGQSCKFTKEHRPKRMTPFYESYCKFSVKTVKNGKLDIDDFKKLYKESCKVKGIPNKDCHRLSGLDAIERAKKVTRKRKETKKSKKK